MESSKWQIKALEGQQNWTTWKFRVTILLKMHKGAFEVVEGQLKKPTPVPVDAAAAVITQHNFELAAFNGGNNSAMLVLSNSMSEDILQKIMRFNDAREMWLELLRLFDGVHEDRAYTLCMQFFGYKPSSTDNVASILSTLKTMWNDMQNALKGEDESVHLPELMLICKVLDALPEVYFSFKSSWMLVAKSERTIENLTSQLCAYERALQAKDADKLGATKGDEVLTVKASSNFENKSKPKWKTKGKLICHYCQKSGHVITKCFKWIQDGRPPKPTGGSSASSACGSMGSSSLMLNVSVSSAARNCNWYCDNAATKHITHQREVFSEYEKVSGLCITTANGQRANVVGKGKIECVSTVDGGHQTVYLNDVWHVPSANRNLLSILEVHDKNLKSRCISTVDKCQLFDNNGKLMLTGSRESKGDLYKLQIVPVISSVNQEINLAAEDVNMLQLIHERLGHQNKRFIKNFAAQEFGVTLQLDDRKCEGCMYGKSHRLPFGDRQKYNATVPGELLHTDICGPFSTRSLGGALYYVLFKDQYSKLRFYFPIKHKSEAVEKLKQVLAEIKTAGHVVKKLRCDNGGEFDNKAVRKVLSKNGIQQLFTMPYTPEQNGCSERENRTVMETARALMYAHGALPQYLWAEIISTAVYILNRTGPSSVPSKSPSEVFYGIKPRIKHLKVIGTTCYVHIPIQKRNKLQRKAEKCILIGYNRDDGYRLFSVQKRQLFNSRDVVFETEMVGFSNDSVLFEPVEDVGLPSSTEVIKRVESKVVSPDAAPAVKKYTPSTERNDKASVSRSLLPSVKDVSESEESDDEEEVPVVKNKCSTVKQSDVNIRQGLRDRSTIKPPTWRNDYVTVANHGYTEYYEPSSFADASSCDQRAKWMKAMACELNSLKENNTWSLVNLPPGRKAIQNRWVYRVKTNEDGSVDKFKARLVVKGFSQKEGVDFDQTFSPVARSGTIRSVLAVAASEGLVLKQFDISTAFLNGFLDEDIYMVQPDGFADGSDKVCKLHRSLYGLKQAPRCWNERFSDYLIQLDFKPSTADPCLFLREHDGKKVLLVVYVDDGLVAATDEAEAQLVLDQLKGEFKMTVKPATYFLGLQIQCLKDGSIKVSQDTYARKVLDRFGMMDCIPVGTPLVKQGDIPVGDDLDVKFPYREAVGALMYLMTNTRPDLAFSVGLLSRKLDCSTSNDWANVKRVFRYLKGTISHGLLYKPKCKVGIIECFSDADHGGDLCTGRSTSGIICMYAGSAISWLSQLQQHVSISTTEAEIVSASEAARESVWLKRLFSEITSASQQSPMLYVDNQAAVKLAKNPENHRRTKHIRLRDFFIRELVTMRELVVNHIAGEEQLADICTKPLHKPRHRMLCSGIGLIG